MSAVQRVLVFCCGFIIITATSALTAEQAALPPASAASNPSATVSPAPGKTHISFNDGRLSASFKNVALALLVDEISRKTSVAILLQGGVGDQLVSGSFQKLPVDQALRQILIKQDVFFFYGIDEQQPSALKAVWIYPKGKGRGLAPFPPEQWASTRDLTVTLADKDPQARGRAIEALVERKGAAARAAVLKAMQDSSAQVRATALYAALKSGVDLPQEDLASLALHDDSSDVRFLALQTLNSSNSPDLRSIAEEAAKDPNEAVRNTAQEIISRLGPQAVSQPASGQQPAPQGENQPLPNP
jgi:hypothetical protein